jgi:predicted glycosyltransferase
LTTRRLRIWIDLSNSPHVLFFEPVIDALRRRGHEVVVTARRFCNTLALARARGLSVRVIGRATTPAETTRSRGRCRSFARCSSGASPAQSGSTSRRVTRRARTSAPP